MLKSVYHFDQERLSNADIESGYSVAKSLNNLYEKHGSSRKASPPDSNRLLSASQLIRANEKFARKNEVILTNKQLDLIEMLVRQKASVLLTALNESVNMVRKQPETQPKYEYADFKKQSNKRMSTHSKVENKKLATESPLMCKSTSSIDFNMDVNEPEKRVEKVSKRRSSTERVRTSSSSQMDKETKKDGKSKSKDYSNRYGKSKHRKNRKLTIMMKIKEESENELEVEKTTQDENKVPENNFIKTISKIELNEQSQNELNDQYKHDYSERSELSSSELSSNQNVINVYRGVEDLDCYKDYKKILLSLAKKGPKKFQNNFC